MKNFLIGLSIAFCILLAAWSNLNTYFIKENTKRIEVLESVEHIPDTIYVIHTINQQNIKKK